MRDRDRTTKDELLSTFDDTLRWVVDEVNKLDIDDMLEHQITLEDNRIRKTKEYVRDLRAIAQPYLDAANEIEKDNPDCVTESREFPPKWMTSNSDIAAMFRATEYVAFIKYIKKSATLTMTQELQNFFEYDEYTKQVKTGKGEIVTRQKVLYKMDYKEAVAHLPLKMKTIQIYMAEEVRIGQFKIMCKGCGGTSPRPTIFDLGTWNMETPSGPVKIWHYENSQEWIDKIASFSPFKRDTK